MPHHVKFITMSFIAALTTSLIAAGEYKLENDTAIVEIDKATGKHLLVFDDKQVKRTLFNNSPTQVVYTTGWNIKKAEMFLVIMNISPKIEQEKIRLEWREGSPLGIHRFGVKFAVTTYSRDSEVLSVVDTENKRQLCYLEAARDRFYQAPGKEMIAFKVFEPRPLRDEIPSEDDDMIAFWRPEFSPKLDGKLSLENDRGAILIFPVIEAEFFNKLGKKDLFPPTYAFGKFVRSELKWSDDGAHLAFVHINSNDECFVRITHFDPADATKLPIGEDFPLPKSTVTLKENTNEEQKTSFVKSLHWAGADQLEIVADRNFTLDLRTKQISESTK